jgi:hypothetical protein
MIVFVNPRATRPKNRRFPLSVMAIGAALPEDVSWEIVDGNKPDADPLAEIVAHVERQRGSADPVRVVAFTVMPGPQLVSAVPLARALRASCPDVQIVWGGNFSSLYPAPVLAAPYVDWVVRGQGEHTFVDLLAVLDGTRDPHDVAGLCFRERDGSHHIGVERRWVGPDELPAPPYHKIDVADYLHPTILGHRSGVYQASIGCPHGCSFCGVISVFGARSASDRPRDGGASRLARAGARHGLRALLRQQLLRERAAGARRRGAPRAARPALVVRGARRRAVALLRRHVAPARARRPRHGVLRCGVGIRRRAAQDGEGDDDGADRRGGRAHRGNTGSSPSSPSCSAIRRSPSARSTPRSRSSGSSRGSTPRWS